MSRLGQFSPIEAIIEDARNGRMFILVDDERRENEGDLVIPGQMATPDAINFMARFGRGLICLALTRPRVQALRLPLMPQRNVSRHQTAFTVSIEAREGVGSGVSAVDRVTTIRAATEPGRGAADIVSPGHVFPLVAHAGGVLARRGHTEGALELCALAGLQPAAVLCELMNPDGSMARGPEVRGYAARYGLPVLAIDDLVAWRRQHGP